MDDSPFDGAELDSGADMDGPPIVGGGGGGAVSWLGSAVKSTHWFFCSSQISLIWTDKLESLYQYNIAPNLYFTR